jgi:hypothetical protein
VPDHFEASVTIEHKVKAIRAIIAALGDAMRDLEQAVTTPAQPAPGGKRLLVPWIGQNTIRTDDDYTKSDCGAACVAMVINSYRGGSGVTVDAVSIATGKPRGYASASFDTLINVAARFNLRLEHVSYTVEQILADVNAGKPVIVIVDYRSLPANAE